MQHPTLEDAVLSSPLFDSNKWEEFFQGEWLLYRSGDGFNESVFIYEGKIWYGNEKEGSESGYCEGTIASVIPIFLNPETTYYHSHLSQKIDEILEMRKKGFLASDMINTYDFSSRTEATIYSCFDDSSFPCNMYDLGEFLTMLIMDPVECKYVNEK